ncbi:DUF4214 domain-containing protein [Devosia crocina]|uniref:DUF4214 domain-containing protein n=1 Tax=Devosia crocina TaxID=429728 RepID=UPI0015879640|nr:DUF4214 domain-containing protein [Devosia crocina]
MTANDAMAHTVMSYRSFEGQAVTTGYTNETFGYAQSPMARDIAAMQYLYGANYETRSGDTVYRWSTSTGEKFINGVGQGAPGGNKVFETIWDGGGVDTFDLSNYSTALTIDLTPGGWTNFNNNQRANLGNGQMAPGNVAVAYLFEGNPARLIENAIGGTGDDRITGNVAGNVLVGGAGNDTIYGVGGQNILIGDGVGNEFSIVGLRQSEVIAVDLPKVSTGGNDVLVGGNGNDLFVPGLGHNEVRGGGGTDTVVLDFNRDALTITASVDGVMNIVYAGGSVKMSGVEILALRDGIFALDGSVPASAADGGFGDDVALLYQAGFGRSADAPGLAYWTDKVHSQADLREVALSFLDSDEFEHRFGTSDNMAAADYVGVLYRNILDREGEAEGLNYWTQKLSSGSTNQADLLLAFAFSEENRQSAAPQADEFGFVAISKTDWAAIWAKI